MVARVVVKRCTHLLDRVVTAGSLANHDDIRRRFNDGAKTSAHDGMIVGDEDSDGLGHLAISSGDVNGRLLPAYQARGFKRRARAGC